MVYFRGSQVCAISMNDERLYTQDANMKLMYTLKSTVVGPKEDCDSHYVLWGFAGEESRQENLRPSGVVPG